MQKLLKAITDTLTTLKSISVELLKVALPLTGGAITLEILTGLKLGVLTRLVDSIHMVGVTSELLSWSIVVAFFMWLNDKYKFIKVN